MSRLNDYQAALLAAQPEISGDELSRVLEEHTPEFATFVIDHGLGPLWHERTGHPAFHECRMQAEALFLAQEAALQEIDAHFESRGFDYVVIKGAGHRRLLYEKPALRACHDIDLLVRPDNRVEAAIALASQEFRASAKLKNISHEIALSGSGVDIDLHWRLLRDGRLPHEDVEGMLARRQKTAGHWTLSNEDTAFVQLVHPTFTKHLAGWDMGLHRVADTFAVLRLLDLDWDMVYDRLKRNEVCTAAWASLQWTKLLAPQAGLPKIDDRLRDLQPGALRRKWLQAWLERDLPARTAKIHKIRLLLFSLALHDGLGSAWRALVGRYRAHLRRHADLAEFRELLRQ